MSLPKPYYEHGGITIYHGLYLSAPHDRSCGYETIYTRRNQSHVSQLPSLLAKQGRGYPQILAGSLSWIQTNGGTCREANTVGGGTPRVERRRHNGTKRAQQSVTQVSKNRVMRCLRQGQGGTSPHRWGYCQQ